MVNILHRQQKENMMVDFVPYLQPLRTKFIYLRFDNLNGKTIL